MFRLEPLGPDALRTLAERGLEAEGATAEPGALDGLVDRSGGDGRQVLTSLEVAVALAIERRGRPAVVNADDVTDALGVSALRYGRDDHYDVISAFIKSIRGSDPDAGLYWLARMLEAGEDARFIARRLVVLASEDVGMADPTALLVAVAAAGAVEHVGLPEAQLNLAQAVVHLATAPKSNRAALGIWNARTDVREGRLGEVPAHLPRQPLQERGVDRPRCRLRVPARRPAGLAAPALPARRAGRPPLLRAGPARLRGRGGPPSGGEARRGRGSRGGGGRRGPGRRARRLIALRHANGTHGSPARRGRTGYGRAVTAGELAIVLGTVLCSLGFAALIVVLVRVLDALKDLRAEVEDLRAETGPLLDELRSSVDVARDDLERFDRVLGSAEAISSNVQGVSRVARAALSTPVIKTVALASGTSKAARRLRRKEVSR